MRKGENGGRRRKLTGPAHRGPASRRTTIRIRRQSAAQMPLGFRSDVSNGSGISMANGTCQIPTACLAKGFTKSDGPPRSFAARYPEKN